MPDSIPTLRLAVARGLAVRLPHCPRVEEAIYEHTFIDAVRLVNMLKIRQTKKFVKSILKGILGLKFVVRQICQRLLIIQFQRVSIGRDSFVSLKARLKCVSGGEIYIGNRCQIYEYAMILSYGGCIRLGDDCSVNPFCILYGHGGLTIGKGVRIASHTVFIPSNHNFNDIHRYIFEQGETSEGIFVEDDVWIGTRVTVLDGVTIKKGCVIAAGAVVSRSTEPYGIYAGVPAKKIGSRLTNQPKTR